MKFYWNTAPPAVCTEKRQEQKLCSSIHCHVMITLSSAQVSGSKQFFCDYLSQFQVLQENALPRGWGGGGLGFSPLLAVSQEVAGSEVILEASLLVVWRMILAVSRVLSLAVEWNTYLWKTLHVSFLFPYHTRTGVQLPRRTRWKLCCSLWPSLKVISHSITSAVTMGPHGFKREGTQTFCL